MSFRSIFASLALGLIACATHAAIVINGVTTESYYGTSVTFTVPNEAGYVIVSELDGLPINASSGYTATGAGYHELFVTKTPSAGGAAETRLVQFIINARVGADTGLANWVPLEAVDAPADALATAGVDFYLPRRVPAGISFPLVARLTKQDDTIAKLNATAVARTTQGRAVTWRVFRGAGAGNWNVPTSSGPLDLTLQIGDRTFVQTVDIVATPSWQALTGNVVGTQTFGPNQFVTISGDVTVPAGATLRFEAGTVVRVNPQATIDVQGALIIAGTTDEPVFFTRFDPAEPWGGFWIRGTAATADIRGAFLTGAGADQGWIGSHGYSSHKPEQPVIACDNSTVTLTDTWIVDNAEGQGMHGNRALVTLTRCLVQRTKSCGQFNNGRLRVFDSHVVEIPTADYVFADDDNDGIYITGAPADPLLPHELRNSVVGWVKDDGIDAGSGSAGVVEVSDCWIDSCFHEGMAWSETRTVRVTNTVTINNGQGIEAGFGSPVVTATGLLSIGNLVGARFGDNYDWDYFGTLNVQNSLLLHNGRDVWGFEWDSWDYRTDRMTIANNAVTAALTLHPNNSVFNPASQGSQIAAFLTAPDNRRGFALARRSVQNPRNAFGGELTVHLDRPASSPIALPWRIVGKRELNSDSDAVLATGTIAFTAGMNAAILTIPALPSAAGFGWIAVLVDDAANAVATGARSCHFVDLPQPLLPSPITLVPFGARWKYLDNGSNQGTAWRAEGFDDAAWRSGLAELGYGDNDEEQRVEDNPTPGYNSGDDDRYATTYFRGTFEVSDPAAFADLALALRYDDGAIVYINGQRVAATSNMPAGEAAFNFYTGGSTPPDNSVLTATLPTTTLHSGTNTIAVEMHQQEADSSDISFDLQLLAAPALVARSISARAGTLQGALYLFWTTSDALPQQSADLATWIDRPELTSPIEIVPAEKRGFFRLVLP